MPSRQEALEALRSLCEEVMESLRILFYMLFTMTKAVEPETQMQESELGPINQLVNEVRSQKAKIQELGSIITSQFNQDKSTISGPKIMSPSPSTTTGLESWEVAEMECLEIDRMYSGPCPGNGVGPSTLQPASPPRMMSNVPMPVAAAKSPIKIAGIPATGRPSSSGRNDQGPRSSQDQNNSQGQLALTQAALEAWGNKVIAWGKKHPGKMYVQVYDTDPGYTKWVLSRMSSLSEDMEDYANYALTRQRLEEAALRHAVQ